ncbi:PTS sugar transporter subunit IIA [Candidiatus Paracoxiella cheracis]|uniref:PTS sugar transporter subunit IIA n=1 Tax=Candidiatus Paracoxiella cheracis TaxID=3405120 RepID=UPI003BF4DFD0
MELNTLIHPELTVYKQTDLNKKKVLELISKLASEWDNDVKYQDILEALQKRERIGHTAIGHGVAIPHARIRGLKRPLCVIISLNNIINFAPKETAPVDLICGLLVPEEKAEEHVEILGALAEKLKDQSYCDKLRQSQTDEELYRAALSFP